jgi:putative addiction module component (TIGR02574 family)
MWGRAPVLDLAVARSDLGTPMNARTDALLVELLALPAAERSELLVALVESLEAVDGESITDAWHEELCARKQAILAGTESLKPWSEVRSRLLSQ